MRDRDVRNAIQAALIATNVFDVGGVFLWGLPEHYGSGSSNANVVAIEPVSSVQRDLWDGSDEDSGLEVTSTVKLTFMARNEDPQLRDEQVELLFDTAADALNGQSLAGFTAPPFTKFASWNWQSPAHPERRIVSTFTYKYIVEGWDNYDITP